MSQPIRKRGITPQKPSLKKKTQTFKVKKAHTVNDKPLSRIYQKDGKRFGVSKLEDKFAKEFLDKIGVRYIRQWEMGSTKRFCDFAIIGHNILIEVDGDYFHGYGLLYENMDAIQKKNNKVDRYKNQWALENGFKMIRIWEHEIKNEPMKVMRRLRKLFGIPEKKVIRQR